MNPSFKINFEFLTCYWKKVISVFIIENITIQETKRPMTAWGKPTISQSVKQIVSPETNFSAVAFAMRLGAVLIRKTKAPTVAACLP